MSSQELGPEHDIGPVQQIPIGEGRNFRIGTMTVAVFHTHAGQIYATQAECPHKRGPLADGLIGGTTLICPLHERAFSLETGEEAGTDCRLAVYPARITAGARIAVRIPG